MTRATLYADGGARGNPGPAGSGAVLLDEHGEVIAELRRSLGHATNNVAGSQTRLCRSENLRS